MIIGIGIDIADLERIRRIVQKDSDRFLKRVYTPEELDICMARKDPVPGLAARFAAKEAFSKCFGLGWGSGLAWRDVGVINNELGKPELLLRNKAIELTSGKKTWVSLSHTDKYAVASVIIEEA